MKSNKWKNTRTLTNIFVKTIACFLDLNSSIIWFTAWNITYLRNERNKKMKSLHFLIVNRQYNYTFSLSSLQVLQHNISHNIAKPPHLKLRNCQDTWTAVKSMFFMCAQSNITGFGMSAEKSIWQNITFQFSLIFFFL